MHTLPHLPPPYHYVASFASIIQLPSNLDENVAYRDLVCTEEDKANIFELITSLGDNNKFDLLLKQTYFRNLGTKLNHVYPLKFLAISISTPRLKEAFIAIFDDYFKRTSFMDSFNSSMSREADKGTFDLYLSDFLDEIRMPREKIEPYFLSRDWEGLLRFLMHS